MRVTNFRDAMRLGILSKLTALELKACTDQYHNDDPIRRRDHEIHALKHKINKLQERISTMNPEITAEQFYSVATYSRAKNKDALDSAIKKFRMACNASNDGIRERALKLACAEELRAFA